jgi:hypothetical protein
MADKESKKKPESKKDEKSSTKGFYHYIKQAWKKPDTKILRERMVEWRKSGVFKG